MYAVFTLIQYTYSRCTPGSCPYIKKNVSCILSSVINQNALCPLAVVKLWPAVDNSYYLPAQVMREYLNSPKCVYNLLWNTFCYHGKRKHSSIPACWTCFSHSGGMKCCWRSCNWNPTVLGPGNHPKPLTLVQMAFGHRHGRKMTLTCKIGYKK